MCWCQYINTVKTYPVIIYWERYVCLFVLPQMTGKNDTDDFYCYSIDLRQSTDVFSQKILLA